MGLRLAMRWQRSATIHRVCDDPTQNFDAGGVLNFGKQQFESSHGSALLLKAQRVQSAGQHQLPVVCCPPSANGTEMLH